MLKNDHVFLFNLQKIRDFDSHWVRQLFPPLFFLYNISSCITWCPSGYGDIGHSRKEKLNWGIIILSVMEIYVPQLHFLVLGMVSRTAVIPTVLTHLVMCRERQSQGSPYM